MTKIFHIDRDLDKPLEKQKEELKAAYPDGFEYLWSDGRKIHFIAEEKQETI